ncbi:enoyl-CoA hydratase-related protein [Rhodococcus sp. NPDC057014]|uniref:enoyl-CoA hydratase-related protein n=1 Tax=Rhodococcus sp. NPDC057014 TaxID=3346000 RepID=UPI0036445195
MPEFSNDDYRVSTERHGRVFLIRMERPDKRNAVDAAMLAGLDAAFNELDNDPDLWCGVLSGGDDVFGAGTDLADGPGAPTVRGGTYGVISRRRTTPLVAPVEGSAYGGGFELVLTCAIVVASHSARFALPEVTHGVVANAGARFRGQPALSPHLAKALLLTGRPFGPGRAQSVGLVHEVVAAGHAEEAALATAAQIAANSPVACKRHCGRWKQRCMTVMSVDGN